MKTWIKLYDEKNNKYDKDYTLHGKWSKESVSKFISRRPWLDNPIVKITYL